MSNAIGILCKEAKSQYKGIQGHLETPYKQGIITLLASKNGGHWTTETVLFDVYGTSSRSLSLKKT